MIYVYPITPVPAPRQTRRDSLPPSARFPVRPPVARYRAYTSELSLRQVSIPSPFHHVVFVLAVPESWSDRKKRQHEGMPHTCKPDRDNLEKALLDGVYGSDAHVWDGRATKLWGKRPLLILSAQPIPIVCPFELGPYYLAAEICERSRLRHGVVAPHTPI